MSCSLKQMCLLLSLLAFIVLSEASRSPKSYWEQMLPKKFPTPSSSPSKGTNSVTTSSTTVEINQNILSSDGKKLYSISSRDFGKDTKYSYSSSRMTQKTVSTEISVKRLNRAIIVGDDTGSDFRYEVV
ncbi:hypothetical protein RJ639_014830 [Escallonia herrerae]|uniref:Uncharacterized protein n=1 Tax=Escallonia herrerae TaxID=1293975 RepID=A0AA88VK58_9ASTE|nr:hypothetical protein RJ639_014830 [Escallonia herrerae]